MTTNQTIDGVPRELLASFAAYVQDSPNAIMRARVKELRALLDAPAETVAGHHPACRAVDDYKPGDCSHGCKPSAQGEPVACAHGIRAPHACDQCESQNVVPDYWEDPDNGTCIDQWTKIQGLNGTNAYSVPLYRHAERPAPVAFDFELAAQKLASCMDYPWDYMPEQGRVSMREHAKAIINAAQVAPVAMALPDRDRLRDLIAQAIGGDAYDCVRVWSAWGVGTMSEDDFVPVVDQEARLYEIADACLDELKRLNTVAVPGVLMPGRRPIPAGIESLAQQIYQSWESQPGFVPWVDGGNSSKQYEARQIASRTFELALANQVD